MKQETRIVWKLNGVIIAMVSVVIIAIAWSGHVEDVQYRRELTRLNLGFHSDSILQGMEDLMQSHDVDGMEAHLRAFEPDSELYGRLRILSHRPGEVVASRLDDRGTILPIEDAACTICHELENPARAGVDTLDGYENGDDDSRLSMLTPILCETSCQTTDCHAQNDLGEILGLLDAQYSLAIADPLHGGRELRRFLGAAFAIILSGLVLGFLLHRLLNRPIATLIHGTRRGADGDLDFRFEMNRKDEIGGLADSFDAMTEKLKTHQNELRNAMEYLEGMIESSADIIITVTPRHLIQTFNRGAEEALGYTRAEIQGQRIEVLFANPKDREYALDQLSHTDNVRNFRTDMRTKDGELRNVLLTLSRLRDHEGKPIGTFGISKDITEERRLIRQVIQSKKLAAIGEAVTGIQHAIKNMLNALKGGSYLVRKGIEKDNKQRLEEGWGMVEEGIERMTSLSLSLLNYAKEWKPEYDEVDLSYMVPKVHEVVVQSAADKGVEVTFRVPKGPSLVQCDRKLVHMAVMDIISNAIDACVWKDYEPGETPRIAMSVHSSKSGNLYNIEIRDNGCGMTKEILKNIFTPFFSTKKQWGTGLGLALTSRVIDIHGGTIDVESEPGKGTMFRIVLPTSDPKHAKESADGQEGSSH